MKKGKVFIGIMTAVCVVSIFSGCTLEKDALSESMSQSTTVIIDDDNELSTVQSEQQVIPSEETESPETKTGLDIVITDEGEIFLPLAP